MVPKTGTQPPFSRFAVSETELAGQIGSALRDELGGSRRATKTVMRWTGVSDHSARAWLHGTSAPSGLHLLMLAANSSPVMAILLRLTGHDELTLALRLRTIESGLEKALREVRLMQSH